MDQRQLRALWLTGFAVVVIAPSMLWFLAAPEFTGTGVRKISLWSNLSVVTGLLATSAMVCAVVLPSRIRSLNRAFGIENVLDLHRFLGIATAALVLLHVACVVAADPTNTALLNFAEAPGRAQNATMATLGLVAIVVLAICRKKFDLSYEFWRTSHIVLAVGILVTSALHIVLLNQLMADPTFAMVLTALAFAVVLVFGYRWVWRNIYDQSTEFLVREVRLENETVATLVLEPRLRGDGTTTSWAFAPGQFAWIRLDRSATGQEHPFTISSSAHDDTTQFTIRGAGDFTRRIRRLRPGQPVWVDGPHGAFTSDLATATAGFVLMAGGVGITPMLSMVRTAAHRDDPRPYRLVVVASAPEDLFFREELAVLRRYVDLEVTEVLRRPRPDWSGPIGGIDAGLMELVLGDDLAAPQELDYFICGPPAMVVDAMQVLDAMSVPAERIHTEQFDFV